MRCICRGFDVIIAVVIAHIVHTAITLTVLLGISTRLGVSVVVIRLLVVLNTSPTSTFVAASAALTGMFSASLI